MDFFPHDIQITILPTATSASKTQLADYLNNFLSFNVATASMALNVTGSPGAAGTNQTFIGPTGSVGPVGVTGFRGNNVYLLSGSWATGSCAGGSCYSVLFGTQYANKTCNFDVPTQYYMNTIVPQDGVTVIFYDNICTSPATSLVGYAYGAYGAVTDNNGYYFVADACQASGGGCVGFCGMGQSCPPGCVCPGDIYAFESYQCGNQLDQ